ncbi:MAG TPA: single-stranded-DNA-specific exonuclease RecJ [Isosphaeraceae bacterium]
MSTRWKIRPFDADRVGALTREAGLSPLVAQLLLNRGVADAATARTFLDARLTSLHDPATLPGAVEAAERIAAAIREGRKIVIYGDYDVDGVCGTSLLWSCLKLAGAKDVEYYIPHRVDEGYGVNSEALIQLVRGNKAELVITVDCGISAIPQARLAKDLGVGLIITDHHTIGPELPEADVLVHPRLPGSVYPFGDLCGCGVAFKVAWQVCKAFGDGKKASPHLRDFLMKSLSQVALASVADVVPITGENRLLVKHGLAGLAESPSLGLQALLRVSAVDPAKGVNTGQVGFRIAPRINAAGRLERAMLAVELLTTEDFARAGELASNLDEFNTRRQELESTIVREAHEMVDAGGGLGERGAIVVGRKGWHPGVIGIVAGRMAEAYHRPAIVVALGDGISQGSARSVPGFNLYEAIAACSGGLEGFGGHSAAAGLKIMNSAFDDFARRFDDHCRSALTAEHRQKVLNVDAEVPLAAMTTRVVEDIDRMEPFGVGNPAPLVAVSNARLVGDPRYVGEGGRTVQLRLGQGESVVKAVAFGQADRWKKFAKGAAVSVVGQPQINDYNGRREVQILIRDFKAEDGAHAEPA